MPPFPLLFLTVPFSRMAVLELSLLFCVLLAWLANFGLKSLFPQPGRRLLTLFACTQMFLLLINIMMLRGSTGVFPHMLWNLDREWTIPSIHSTVQLLLLGSLCYMNGLAAARPRLSERAWWLILGLAITGLAMLEFVESFKYTFPGTWILIASGTILLLTSLLVMRRQGRDSPRRNGLLLLLGGLGLWAFGAFRLDAFRLDYPNYPVTFQALEETMETLGIAVALAGAASYGQAARPRPRFPRHRFLASLCLTNAALALLLVAATVWEDRLHQAFEHFWRNPGTRITADIDDGALALRFWSVGTLRPGKSARVKLWLYATRPLENDFGFTVQLIDQASLDTTLTFNQRSGIDTSYWTPGEFFNRQPGAGFHVPETAPVNRAQWLTLSFWEIVEDDFLPLKISASDYPTLGDTHVILDERVLYAPAPNLHQEDALASFANGFALQRAVIPDRAPAGEVINIDFSWLATGSGEEDWTQFLHFEQQDGDGFWNVDQFPLGKRLPTRLWYTGLQDSERWKVTLPASLAPGAWSIYTGLYRLADMERLAVTLADGTQPPDRRIPLGVLFIDN